eukprot:sb/3466777/
MDNEVITHNGRLAVCGVCSEVFPEGPDVVYHLKHSHVNTTAFNCGSCFEFFHLHVQLEHHMLERHLLEDGTPSETGSVKFSLPAVKQEAVDNYMAVPECREEVRLACPLCEELFPKMSLFQMHMSWKHKGKEWDKEGLCSAILRVTLVDGPTKDVPPPIMGLPTDDTVVKGRVYTCGECGVKVYGQQSMDRHAATHTKITWYRCTECTMVFLERDAFLRHDASAHHSISHLNIQKNHHGDLIGVSLEEILTAQECLTSVLEPRSESEDVEIDVVAIDEDEEEARKTHKRGHSNSSLPDPSDPFHDLLLLTKYAVRQPKIQATR